MTKERLVIMVEKKLKNDLGLIARSEFMSVSGLVAELARKYADDRIDIALNSLKHRRCFCGEKMEIIDGSLVCKDKSCTQ
jgi:hypothetical protein